MYSFVASAGASIGLLAGGILTQGINWHWILFVNLPIGIATAFYARRVLPADKGIGLEQGADAPRGAALEFPDARGLHDRRGQPLLGVSAHAGFGTVAVGLLAAFVLRQARAANPLVPLRVFRSRTVTGADVIAQVLMVAGLFGMFFLGAGYMQRVLHYDAIEVGLGVPTGRAGDRHALARILGPPDHALPRPGDAAPGTGASRCRGLRCSVPPPRTPTTSETCCRRWSRSA